MSMLSAKAIWLEKRKTGLLPLHADRLRDGGHVQIIMPAPRGRGANKPAAYLYRFWINAEGGAWYVYGDGPNGAETCEGPFNGRERRPWFGPVPPAPPIRPNDDDYRVAQTVLMALNPAALDLNEATRLIAAYRVACAEEIERRSK